jgi:hypothetical protein
MATLKPLRKGWVMKAEGWMEWVLRLGFVLGFVTIFVLMIVFLGIGVYKEVRSLWAPCCPGACVEKGWGL